MVLRVNEVYKSFQGEGPNTGDRTLFVRFVGCNLKCPGWPCDTQHAIDPKLYRKDMISFDTPESFANYVLDRLSPRERICLTGGEVTLQPAQDLERALVLLKAHTAADIELFTNGTIRWPEGFANHFSNIILDWKLNGSGEGIAITESRGFWDNLRQLRSHDAIKFTIANRTDFLHAADRWDYLRATRRDFMHVYAGPVWGLCTAEEVAGWILEADLPWKLNVQTHKFVFDPNRRGV